MSGIPILFQHRNHPTKYKQRHMAVNNNYVIVNILDASLITTCSMFTGYNDY